MDSLLDSNPIDVQLDGSNVRVGTTNTFPQATVTTADISLDNGIVHKVDKVIVPDSLAGALPTQTLAGLAQDTPSLSTLASLVQGASDGVRDALTTGSVTLLAPTNDAFMKVETAAVQYLQDTANKAVLDQVLLFHAIPSSYAYSSGLTDRMELGTAQGSGATQGMLTVSISDDMVKFQPAYTGAATVETPDQESTSGIAHLVSDVLMPVAVLDSVPTTVQKSIVEPSAAVSTLRTLIDLAPGAKSVLEGTPADGKKLTVFAPSNDAFTALTTNFPAAVKFLTNPNVDKLEAVLALHVVQADTRYSAADLAIQGLAKATQIPYGETTSVPALGNGTLAVTRGSEASGGAVSVASGSQTAVNVAVADLAAGNGVAHVVDGVILSDALAGLLPTQTVVQVAGATGSLSTLTALVGLASDGVQEALVGAGVTLFAPSNDAFAALSASQVAYLQDPANQADLDAVLLYHVIGDSYTYAESLTDGMTLTTAQPGAPGLAVSVSNGMVTVNGAKVTTADVETTTGIVHITDAVFVPPSVADKLPSSGASEQAAAMAGAGVLAAAVAAAAATMRA